MQCVKTASTIRSHAVAWAIGTAVAAVFTGAHCSSNNVDHPPPLGNCVPTKSVPCTGGGVGTGAGGPGSARDAGLDAGLDASSALEAAPMCVGQTTMLLNPQNVTCVPCVVGNLDARANCCSEDANCAADTTCQTLVSCSVLCAGNTACIANCQAMSPQDTNFTAYAGCIQTTCPQCPALSGGVPRDM